MGTQLPSPKGAQPPIFGPYLLRPNGCMDQDTTWYGGRPRPRRLRVRRRLLHPPKRGQSPPIFDPCLLWPNNWMDQDGTWHRGRRQPRRLCVRWGPSPLPKKGRSPQFAVNVYCGQTAAWIKIGTEVDLGPGHVLLDGDPALRKRDTTTPSPLFGPCLLWLLLSSCCSYVIIIITFNLLHGFCHRWWHWRRGR